ncbi:transcription elongation factor SPT6-like isoform X2 [Convolutriloba macropyga]
MDLLEENLGVKLKRKKFTRVKLDSDEEEQTQDDDLPQAKKILLIKEIERELFQSESEGEESSDEKRAKKAERKAQAAEMPLEQPDLDDEDEEDSDAESDVNDFVVDDAGVPMSRKGKKKKKGALMNDENLAEAQELFGADFDLADLNNVNRLATGYDDEDDEDYDEEYEEEMEESDAEFVVDDETGETMTSKMKKAKAERGKRVTTKKMVQFDPKHLERGHYLPEDEKIKSLDIPERFQLRKTVVEPFKNDEEAEEEAKWIYTQAFMSQEFISNQIIKRPSFNGPTIEQLESEGQDRANLHSEFLQQVLQPKNPDCISKIRDVLKLLRDQMHEVPFIHTYRREFCEPDLDEVYDLWTIWQHDERWLQLQTRKEKLTLLFTKMRNYLGNLTRNSEDYSRIAEIRPLEEFDINQLKHAETMQQLEDVYQHFLLHYGHYIQPMIEAERMEKAKENGDDPAEKPPTKKKPQKKQMYQICIKNKIFNFANLFGLSPEQFGVNVMDQYQKHEPTTSSQYPSDIALELICDAFDSKEAVINAAVYMVAQQLAHDPSVRKSVRKSYEEKVGINSKPTKKGQRDIDENHQLYSMKYLKGKEVRTLKDGDYLKLHDAESQGLITMTFKFRDDVKGSSTQYGLEGYVEDLGQLYCQDAYSEVVNNWNDLRKRAVKRAVEEFLFPTFEIELRLKLLKEAQDYVIREAVIYLHTLISYEPWDPKVNRKTNMPDDDDDYESGARVVAIGHGDAFNEVSFAAYLDKNGVCRDYVRIPNLVRFRERDERGNGLNSVAMSTLSDFIQRVRPHVCVICTSSYVAKTLGLNVEKMLISLEDEMSFPVVAMELINDDVATVFEKSNKGTKEFPDYPNLLRRAISAGRRLQDPLAEFCQMADDRTDLLSFKFHRLQDLVPQDDLVDALTIELVSMVNKIGVDVNRALEFPHYAPMLQFVCGLGPRKASALLQVLSRKNQKLANRTHLVTQVQMGPKLFVNCAGFIKIDVKSFDPDSTDEVTWLDPLDSTRIHPETYEWARKMAVDALEYDDVDADEIGQQRTARAVEEIMEASDKLKDLDLDAFADELDRQGYGKKNTTLYDISLELSNPFKDRIRFTPESDSNIQMYLRFEMLTKDNPDSLFIGKLLVVTVIGFKEYIPPATENEEEKEHRSSYFEKTEEGTWRCPYCKMEDFYSIDDLWNHFDMRACTGRLTGIRVKLENGMNGFIPIKYMSDNPVEDPREKVAIGQTIYARIRDLEVSTFKCFLTCRTSDLVDQHHEYAPTKDPFYDQTEENYDKDVAKAESEKEKKKKQYMKRVIVHPNFENVTYEQCIKRLQFQEQGDCLFRPSSKGAGYLTCTWKVDEDIYQHISIVEQQQENSFSLGKLLVINEQEFEDLDEVIATYIKPMALLVREISMYKYYCKPQSDRTIIERDLLQQKMANPSKIPYFLTPSVSRPGCFSIVYLPRQTVIWEYISITPNGFKYRGKVFDNLNKLLGWFKVHFRDPRPQPPPQPVQNELNVTGPAQTDYGFGLSQPSHPTPGGLGGGRPQHSDYGNRQMTSPRYDSSDFTSAMRDSSNHRPSSISPPLITAGGGGGGGRDTPGFRTPVHHTPHGHHGSYTPRSTSGHHGSMTPSRSSYNSHQQHQMSQPTYS